MSRSLTGETYMSMKNVASLSSKMIRDRGGQGLLETALLLPAAMILVLNAVSIGYMFSVLLNMTTAVRQGAQYSIRGTTTVLEAAMPKADAVKSLVYDNLNTSVPAAANSPARVCSAALGLSGTGTAQVANCTTYTIPGSQDDITFSDLQADPEAPYLVLHRVDVQYTIKPLFAGSPFNLVPQLTLHRTIVMRAMP
jgi:Flp pilus assembly protein TadG